MSLVKSFGAIDGIIYIQIHFNGAFGFDGFSDPSFLFMEEILHDLKKGYGSILSSISSQTLSVSPAKNNLVDL